ncbi:uncharacterized protein LOC116197007 [Punica granatum]|uniref:Uncharacterized protein LOC116197007 n=1 Tax=Punica granatum TaxID=22663 RepID=A0A6P8CI38_PUNGR|nr:uncharacterized protein LOC116197007 [Punica granatum]
MLSKNRCVIGSLGILLFRCDHDSKTKANTCILEAVKENNHEHFFVVTQDADLQKKLQELQPWLVFRYCRMRIPFPSDSYLNIPGIPVMFLEKPSSVQSKFVKDSEEKRLHITEEEWKRLEKKTGVVLASQEPNHSDEEDLGGHRSRHNSSRQSVTSC